MKDVFLEITQEQIEFLYNRLKLSTHRIIDMVQEELALKNIFNPKRHSFLDHNKNDEGEFLIFQSLGEYE